MNIQIYFLFLRMLGYSEGRPTSNSLFGRVNDTFAMDDVQCLGDETTILDCPHRTNDDCGAGEGAGAICEGPFPFDSFGAFFSYENMLYTLPVLVLLFLCHGISKGTSTFEISLGHFRD